MVRETMVRRPEAVNAHPPECPGYVGHMVAWRKTRPLKQPL